VSRVTPFGDAGWLVEVDGVRAAHQVATAIEEAVIEGVAPAGVLGVTVGYGSVVVTVDPAVDPAVDPERWLGGLVGGAVPTTGLPGDGASAEHPERPVAATVEIPVTFDGADLGEVASLLGLGTAEVVGLLTGVDLEVAFLGFAPGFPYLVGLPGPLAGLSRRTTPRVSVPAGSVAVAGGFAAVYPRSTPGGWNLLGRTGLTLFDPDTPPYARLRAGDTVRFILTDVPPPPRRRGNPPGAVDGNRRRVLTAGGPRSLRVLEPGLFTLVQDAGRPSLSAVGVPVAGPADPVAMTLANRLVGNPDGAAALEVTARGPSLEVLGQLHLAVVGAGAAAVELRVDGRTAPADAVVPVTSGQVVSVGALRSGLRAYLAVAGGLETPTVAGSRSSDVLSGLGPGALREGDRLGIGAPGRPHGHLVPTDEPPVGSTPIRVLAGPTPFDPAGDEFRKLLATAWQAGPDVNRIGVRLHAEGVRLSSPPRGIPSTGMRNGAIQVPPDGRPIVLLPDHATVGGYPVVATVITADLGRLGQVRGGDAVRFEEVTLDEARTHLVTLTRTMAQRVTGWFPTASGT